MYCISCDIPGVAVGILSRLAPLAQSPQSFLAYHHGRPFALSSPSSHEWARQSLLSCASIHQGASSSVVHPRSGYLTVTQHHCATAELCTETCRSYLSVATNEARVPFTPVWARAALSSIDTIARALGGSRECLI